MLLRDSRGENYVITLVLMVAIIMAVTALLPPGETIGQKVREIANRVWSLLAPPR